jgi:hypothetical protein
MRMLLAVARSFNFSCQLQGDKLVKSIHSLAP